jgi:hypothetical protein
MFHHFGTDLYQFHLKRPKRPILHLLWQSQTPKKIAKIGAKVVIHARYVTFQMAEVLVSKSLFYEILAKIHRLNPVPIGYD